MQMLGHLLWQAWILLQFSVKVTKTVLNAKIFIQANPWEWMSLQLHWSGSCRHGIPLVFLLGSFLHGKRELLQLITNQNKSAHRHFYSRLRDWNSSQNQYISVPTGTTQEMERELLWCAPIVLVCLWLITAGQNHILLEFYIIHYLSSMEIHIFLHSCVFKNHLGQTNGQRFNLLPMFLVSVMKK